MPRRRGISEPVSRGPGGEMTLPGPLHHNEEMEVIVIQEFEFCGEPEDGFAVSPCAPDRAADGDTHKETTKRSSAGYASALSWRWFYGELFGGGTSAVGREALARGWRV